MDKEIFEELQRVYSPIISNIFVSNTRFYRTNQKIKWMFGFDERVAVFAWCNKKTNVVTINIASVDFAFQKNEPLHIEYFLLHEIRHLYQHMEIEDYKTDQSKCNNIELTKKWIEEENDYQSALDKEGNENPKYFSQDIEMDAFAYSYAVMKYKYGEVDYLFIPEAYKNDEFNEIVTGWLDTFKKERL